MFWFLKLKLSTLYCVHDFVSYCHLQAFKGLLSNTIIWCCVMTVKPLGSNTMSASSHPVSYPDVRSHVEFSKALKPHCTQLLLIISRNWISNSCLCEDWSSYWWINFHIAEMMLLPVIKRPLDNWSVAIVHSSQCKLPAETQKINMNGLCIAHY